MHNIKLTLEIPPDSPLLNEILDLLRTYGPQIRPEIQPPDNGGITIKRVSELLRQLGIPAHVQGYGYIREAVLLIANDSSMMQAVIRKLYPAIAAANNTTVVRVERAIRHAIVITCERGCKETMDKIFGNKANGVRTRPTNSEFMAGIVEYLRLN